MTETPEHPAAEGGRAERWEPWRGGHECHSALINLCPPAPGEAAGAAARTPLCPHYTSIY